MRPIWFVVSTHMTGRRRDVRIVVYEDVKSLQRAASQYCGSSTNIFEDAQAVSQPRYNIKVESNGHESKSNWAGVVRLCRGQDAAILAHEMVHMGLAIYRGDMGRAPLGNMKNEETLAHIVSDLVREANRKLWEKGVYTRNTNSGG